MSNQPGTSLRFTCTQCHKPIVVPMAKSGSSIECPSCQATIQVPSTIKKQPVEGEAPAPQVNSGFEAISNTRTSAPTPQPAADVPMMQPQADSEVAVTTLSMGSSEAADPTAAPARIGSGLRPKTAGGSGFRAAAAGAPRTGTRAPSTKAPPSRKGVVAVAAIVLLAVIAGVGITVKNGMERKAIQDDIESLLEKAKTAYVAGDIDGAAKEAAAAAERVKTSPQTLDAGMVKKWNERATHFKTMQEQVSQAQVIFNDAEKNLFEARSRIENKKTLLGEPSDDNRPVLAKLDGFLAEIEKLEKAKKIEKLKGDIAAADKLYKDGKLDEAAEKAARAVRDMDIAPKVQERSIETRADILKKRAEKVKAAKAVRLAVGKNFAEAKKKIQEQLDGIDEAEEDLRPVKAAIASLKKELQDEEKKSKALAPEEAEELKALVRNLQARDRNVHANKGIEGDSIAIDYDGKPLKVSFQRTALARQIVLEAGDNRLLVDSDAMIGQRGRPGRVLRHAIALGEAMKKAGIVSEDVWDATNEAPLVSARRTGDDGKEYVFLGDRLYVGKPADKTESQKDVEADFKKRAEALAVAVEGDQPTAEDIRSVIAFAVRCSAKTHTEQDWYDHLPGEFVRGVIDQGYIEDNMAPGSADRLKKALTDYREGYAKISNPKQHFDGGTAAGDRAKEMLTFEDHAIWQLYDKTADTTTFAIKNPDEEKDCLFILYEFAGKLDAFPENGTPKRVRMTHQSVGVTATYDVATGKMEYEQDKWDLSAALESPPMPAEYMASKGFGIPGWSLPPHVLLVDYMGHTKGIVTPHGKLETQDFRKIADKAKRTEAMEAFLNTMAKVLPSSGYLHLYFRYFHEYILDSPITSKTNLLGSRAHCGDIHQTAYQSLERLMGGRYVGDCDDLAEFYMNVTRRQNKLSYVMALPSHAACGWAEQPGGKDTDYHFYIVDTGPPREFTNRSLEKAIEMACRAYDDDKTMRFDPKSLGYLFRFNGEPTRTPYYLSSRMYIDREYGEAMEKVQSYWHFHFYALGIKTMTDMITKGDKVPENCIELAGLYGQVHEIEDSIKWTNEALKQFGPEDRASRYSEQFRIAMMEREDHNNDKAYDALQSMISELKKLERDRQWFNYTSMRLQTMGLLENIDKPFEAWAVVQHDIYQFATRGALRIEHVGGLTDVYRKMMDIKRSGKELSQNEQAGLKSLEEILTFFYDKAVFAEPEDDFNAYMRKYAFIGVWYAAKYGMPRFQQELLKDGPWPDAAKGLGARDHRNRANPEEEDWKWIRLAIPAYALCIADAVDMDDPPEKWRKDDVVKLTDAMLRASDHARKFGSLASSEFELLSSRVFRDFIAKDWKDLEKVLAEVKERDWARLTSDIAETFGKGARFVTKDEFIQQYRVFTKYVKTRPSFFTVVYEAYRADAFDSAVAASQIALEFWPGDEDMNREAKYLKELAAKRIAKAKDAPKPEEKKPDAPKPDAPKAPEKKPEDKK